MASKDRSKSGDKEKFGSGTPGSHAPGPDSGEATESAVKSYEQTEQAGSSLHPTSGDRNTAQGSSAGDLGRATGDDKDRSSGKSAADRGEKRGSELGQNFKKANNDHGRGDSDR